MTTALRLALLFRLPTVIRPLTRATHILAIVVVHWRARFGAAAHEAARREAALLVARTTEDHVSEGMVSAARFHVVTDLLVTGGTVVTVKEEGTRRRRRWGELRRVHTVFEENQLLGPQVV